MKDCLLDELFGCVCTRSSILVGGSLALGGDDRDRLRPTPI